MASFIAVVLAAGRTLTELPVLSDHLAVASMAVAGIRAVAVDAATFTFARVVFALVHIYAADREGEREQERNKRINKG